ncbi:hypothetical protein [Cupriavidus basilensis]|uniref:hypothetical protein n=1 Tax=Cupriavidus basilensis TaxID=68895 RepID=UPI0023E81F53|nr:hypothetical protein [Cupriavidus basilensis]MDF3886386.1 hypothetical protein [Cupriavidus basilensis]
MTLTHAAVLASLLLASLPSHAQGTNTDSARIDPGALAGVAGRAAVNLAAGSGNAQSNQAAIADIGSATVQSRQHAGASVPAGGAVSQIGNGAFANGSGLLSANVASGNGNLQSNAAVLAPAASVRIEAISDGLLAAESAGGSRPGSAGHAAGPREAVIQPDAYRNATGLVQLNQTAGSGNISSNVFVLRPPAGTFF